MMWLLLALGCRTTLAPDRAAPADAVAAWEAALSEVVTADGRVDYDALEARRDALAGYVAWLADPPRGRVDRENTQHAFWINAYNALVLYGVLHDGRPASVDDVPGWLPWAGSGFFYERAYLVQGEWLSLWEIQHERLRGRVMDYRDHAALHDATMGCPPLRAELYRADRLEDQLRDQMERWVADDARGLRIEGDVAVFSPRFDRFAEDFELLTVGDDLCTTAARYAVGPRKQALLGLARAGCPHRFFEADRRLADASGR